MKVLFRLLGAATSLILIAGVFAGYLYTTDPYIPPLVNDFSSRFASGADQAVTDLGFSIQRDSSKLLALLDAAAAGSDVAIQKSQLALVDTVGLLDQYARNDLATGIPTIPHHTHISLASQSSRGQVLSAKTKTTVRAAIKPSSPPIDHGYIKSVVANLLADPNTQVMFRGNAGPQGSKGDKGDPGISGAPAPIQPVGWSGITPYIIPAQPAQNFSGMSLFAATDLSSERFVTNTETVQGTSTIKTLSVTGNTSFGGNLAVTGTITGSVAGSINPGLTSGSILFQGPSGIAEDNANFFYDATNHRLGIGTTTPPAALSVGSTSQFQVSSAGSIAASTAIATSGQITSSVATGTAPLSVASTTPVTNLTLSLDAQLPTISTSGKVLNSATTASSSNTASSIVARDASGNFTAGTITANSFSGAGAFSTITASGAVNLSALTTNGPIFTSGGNGTLNSEANMVVARGGTGVGTLTTNGVLYGNSTSAVQATSQGGANTVLIANNAAPQFSAAITVGTSVTSPTINATTVLQTAGTTRIDSTGNLTNIGTITSGLVNGQTLSSTANFTGSVAIAGAVTAATSYNGLVVTANTGVITSGTWNGSIVGLAYGGTNSSATPTAGSVAYGTGSAYAFNTAGSANQILTSGGAGAPTFQNLSTLLTQGTNISITGTTNATIATVNNPAFSTSVTSPIYTATGALAIKPGSDSTTAIQLQTSGGTSVLNVDTTNSRVGIGTASPAYTLDVNKSVTGDFIARVVNAGNGSSDSGLLINTTQNNVSNYALRVQSSGVDKFSITGLGINLSANTFVASGDWVGVNANENITFGSSGLVFKNGSGDPIIFQDNSGGSEFARFSATTRNFGIGTTSPASKLHVVGTGTFATAGVSGIQNAAHTVTLSGANPTTYATFFADQIGAMTLTGTNAGQTVTDAAALNITSAPVKSTNVAITNSHALLISAGAVSTATNSYGLTVNAQTGATNNYAAAFLSGNVGIGTTTPALTAVYARVLTVGSGAAIGALELTGNGGAAEATEGVISFNNAGSAGWEVAKIQAIRSTSPVGNVDNGSGTLGFFTKLNSGGTLSEKMRVDSAGNVGIGTAAPGVLLEVSKALGAGDQNPAGFFNTNGNGYIQVGTNSAGSRNIVLGYDDSNNYGFLRIAGEAAGTGVSIKDGGNVGIGTTAPAVALDVTSAKTSSAVNADAGSMNMIVRDTTAMAAGVGGGIGFIGKSTAAGGYAGLGSIQVGKLNATDANLSSYMAFSTRDNTGGNLEKMRIDNAGNIGIGTTSQFGSGTGVVGLANAGTNPSANPTAGGVLYASGGALNWRGSSGTVTQIAAADYAEDMPITGVPPDSGDLVSISKIPNLGGDGAYNKFFVEKSNRPYDPALLGVVSSFSDLSKQPATSRPIALVGRVPVKVSAENGAINVGDPITSSQTPGVGMKDTAAGQIIGYALEPLSTGDGKILVFINLTYYVPSVATILQNNPSQDLIDLNMTDSAAFNKLVVTDTLYVGAKLVVNGVIQAKEVDTDRLCVKGVCVTAEQLQMLLDKMNGQPVSATQPQPTTDNTTLTTLAPKPDAAPPANTEPVAPTPTADQAPGSTQ